MRRRGSDVQRQPELRLVATRKRRAVPNAAWWFARMHLEVERAAGEAARGRN